MKKQNKNNAPKWNLGDLYKSIKDPQIQKDFASVGQRVEAFSTKYRGKLNQDKLQAEELVSIFQEYEEIGQDLVKPSRYAYLVFAADSSNPKHGAFLQAVQKQAVELFNKLLFVELELSQLSDATFQLLVYSPELATYQHYLKNINRFKPHRLSEKEEQILLSKSMTGRSAFVRFFEEELTKHQYTLGEGKKKKRTTQVELLDRLLNSDQKIRREAASAFTTGLKELSSRTTYITNVLAEDWAVDAKYRSYPSVEAERHLDNEIDMKTVEVMTGLVTKNAKLAQNYYKLKQEMLGLKTMYDFDRAAPFKKSKVNIPFEQGREMVLEAFGDFSPIYAEVAEQFFKGKWIDAQLRPGKQGGAFCMYITPKKHPYILMNYTGSRESVMTLGHELGHGIHGVLAREQSYLNFSWPITTAEVASIFGEMLIFDSLQKKIKKKNERLELTMGLLDRIMSTIFRQVAMYRFEQAVHTEHQKGELTTEQINDLWRKAQKQLYGKSVTLTNDYDYWWSYIPHFVHTPFYVYAYAFGELLTLALFAQYQKEGSAFVEKYLTILKAGGSQSPAELFEPLGIHLDQESFWQGGLDIVGDLLKQAKTLYTDK